ncbi:LytR C-terminal domain-containing protein [Microbacterium sp.]|uniref:LytR C-terminal domain-containing protein n=1 Tax=Microbacterium sp. TaxID=51671 RepID=UPI0039E36B94
MQTHPTDRFDELPPASSRDARRVGAHRAEQPRIRRGRVWLWAAIATVVLVAVGIAGTLWAGGTFGPGPAASTAAAPRETAEPTLDTSYTVLILNATPQEGLGSTLSADVVAAGWKAADVSVGDAGEHDFAKTTVFYAREDDEGPARGLAEAIGNAEVEFSQAYQDGDDTTLRQLVIVIGMDRADGTESSTP